MGRPREHGQATQASLLAAATDLLAEGGPTAVSVRAVADRAGTTSRAVYSLFGSKEGLLVALAEDGFAALAALVDAIPDTDDPIADLVAVGMDGFWRWALATPALYRLCFDHLPAGATGARAVNAAAGQALARLERRVERVKASAGIEGRSVREVAVQFHALCEGLVAVELRSSLPGPQPDALARHALQALVRRLIGPA